ncbi:nucleolin 2-like isoform X3 [Trifolium pratense]|uniref:nucleolin 2-like isoform X3 n=1 Tax=Trifolium pratense TaxID=57577 RepID=UPI001E6926C8|nr:nucleolin 2-like isoform X3 [Trifolium pratense]
MANESESEVCDNAIPPPKICKRECEDEDQEDVITKKQKRDEVVEVVVKQENEEEINPDQEDVITKKQKRDEVVEVVVKQENEEEINPDQEDVITKKQKRDEVVEVVVKQENEEEINPDQEDVITKKQKRDEVVEVVVNQENEEEINPDQEDVITKKQKRDEVVEVVAKQENEEEINPDQEDVITKKQKRDEVVTKQENEEEINPDQEDVITKKQKRDEVVEVVVKQDNEEEINPDQEDVITKKQKKNEVVEVVVNQENEEEINPDYSEHDNKLEAENESGTGFIALEPVDDGSTDADSPRSFGEDNPEDLESPEYTEEEIEEKVSKTPQERHETPVTLNGKYAESKTIFVRNLSYSVERTDMEDIFKDCGEVVDVRFSLDPEGRFRGFGHVEFGTAEAARKALKLDNTELLNRHIKVGIAVEKSDYPPYKSNSSSSFHKGGNLQSHTVKGFDASLVENKPKSPATPNETNSASKTIYVRNLSYSVERADMENLFKDCGEIVDVRLHTDREGNFKGYGHVQFATAEAAQKAVALNKKVFFNRLMFVGLALERGKYSPNRSWSWSSSFLKDEKIQSQTVPVKCFDTSLAEDKLTCAKEEVKDIEMFDAASAESKVPETPSTGKEKNDGSKTICVRNLSFDVERAEIENIFKDCGEVVDVRLHVDVEFATAEAAEKALELDNTRLMNRPIKVGKASEEGECFPNRGSSISFQKAESFQSLTVFVIGFDTSVAEEKIKASLYKHFCSCGEITRISLPKFPDSGTVKGFAHLDFKDTDGYNKALKLDQTAIGNYWLSVEKAKPRIRRDNYGIGGGRGGYHVGGRDGGDHGERAGWGRSHGAGRHWTANTEHW